MVARSLISLWVSTLVLGCGTPGGIPPMGPSQRYVELFAKPVESSSGRSRIIEGKGPLEVAAILGRAFGEQDSHTDNDILKAELDFGDGSGWTDYTEDSRNKWWEEPLTVPVYHPDWMTRHTYTQPGTYIINGRMTFWDGELLYAEPSSLVTVIVHPAEPGQ